jgi:hypothetical protein
LGGLTELSLVDLFSRESKNRNQFSHNFGDHFGHRRSGLIDLGINDESSNKAFDAFKDFDEGVVASFHRFWRLVFLDLRRVDGESVERDSHG